MSKFVTVLSVVLLLSAAGVGKVQADTHDRALAVVMTNDSNANQIKVYDAETGALLQTLSTNGKGGVGNKRDGAFAAVADAGQSANCWATRAGKYVFTANTASRTLSRVVGTGSNAFLDSAVAATIVTGNPTDLDARDGLLVVIDHGAGQSHLTFFTYNAFGELTARGVAISIGASDANGVALMSPSDRGRD
jgi:hypothetical protein